MRLLQNFCEHPDRCSLDLQLAAGFPAINYLGRLRLQALCQATLILCCAWLVLACVHVYGSGFPSGCNGQVQYLFT